MCVARYCWARSCQWSPGGRGLPCDRRWLVCRVRPWPVVTAVGGRRGARAGRPAMPVVGKTSSSPRGGDSVGSPESGIRPGEVWSQGNR
jgi:hypothetical protein